MPAKLTFTLIYRHMSDVYCSTQHVIITMQYQIIKPVTYKLSLSFLFIFLYTNQTRCNRERIVHAYD